MVTAGGWIGGIGFLLVVGIVLAIMLTVGNPPTRNIRIGNATLPDCKLSLDDNDGDDQEKPCKSSAKNPRKMGSVDLFIGGAGPVGHNYLFRSSEIDTLKNNPVRSIVMVEKQPYKYGLCGKVEDFVVQHPKAVDIPRSFFEMPFWITKQDDEDLNGITYDGPGPRNTNYDEGVYDIMQSVLNNDVLWGVAALRWIKNGANQPTRLLAARLGLPGFCTRFKPTYYDGNGGRENNVDFGNEQQVRYVYQFYEANWTQTHLDMLVHNQFSSRADPSICNSTLRNDPAIPGYNSSNPLCICAKDQPSGNLYGRSGCWEVCASPIPGDPAYVDGTNNLTATNLTVDYACSSTVDYYLLKYALYQEEVHPFTGRNCSDPWNGPCPRDVCQNSFSLYDYYADIHGYRNATHNIPNLQAAQHICEFNVGYFGDCFGAHEPCAYNDWNTIEDTTYGEFCYTPGGISSLCREMLKEVVTNTTARGSSLKVEYQEYVIDININLNKSITEVTTFNEAVNEYRVYTIPKSAGELILAMPPRALRNITGNLVDWMKTKTATNETRGDGTWRGGSNYLTQPKGANPITVNVVMREPYFAFDMERTQMSVRNVGSNSLHSRMEDCNDWLHRTNNVKRTTYSDYWQIEIWKAAFDCVERGECTLDTVRDLVLLDWRNTYPGNPIIQGLDRSAILDVFGKQTVDGWHWQAPGNHNSPEQLVAFAADPIGVGEKAEWYGYNIALSNSGWDLSRDGWVSSGFRHNSRILKRLARYDFPDDVVWWAVNINGHQSILDPAAPIEDDEIDPLVAMPLEFPHMSCDSPTGYCFPFVVDGGEKRLVPATQGLYHGVIIDDANPGAYDFALCKYNPATKICEPNTFV